MKLLRAASIANGGRPPGPRRMMQICLRARPGQAGGLGQQQGKIIVAAPVAHYAFDEFPRRVR